MHGDNIMLYTGYELLWLFFIYALIGWCAEVAVAAYKKHKFINRGFINGPLCPVYGTGAVAFAVFLPELKHNFLFLFLGGTILASFIEYMTGKIMELIFHRKWWDYSSERFQLDGYICLKTSVIWGFCSIVMIWLLNPLIYWIIRLIPEWMGVIVLWSISGLFILDSIGSTLAISGLKKKAGRINLLTDELHKTSKFLENALTVRIQNRLVKAFPNIEPVKDGAVLLHKEKPAVFAAGCGLYKLFSLFFIGAFLGDIVETIFCLLTTGKLMSRSSVVYGPFSIVWGLACALLTLLLYKYKDKSDRYLFISGMVLGGAYEYICSVFTELVFGSVFWDYSGFAFNLGGRINLLYCFFWGFAAVIWMKGIYPKLSEFIERLPLHMGKMISNCLIVFMIINIIISSAALSRYSQRQSDTAAGTAIGQFLDSRFPDERMERIYPNIKFTE